MSRNDTSATSTALNPLSVLARRTRRGLVVCAGLTLCAALFAAWPVGVVGVDPITQADSIEPIGASGSKPTMVALDVAAFDVPVWLTPPPPPLPPPAVEVAAKPSALPPLKLELLGIIREGNTYRAVVYDPDTDKVAVVGSGDTLAGRKVDRVSVDALAIRDTSGIRTLTLKATPGGEGG
jgi:hypothetical protein